MPPIQAIVAGRIAGDRAHHRRERAEAVEDLARERARALGPVSRLAIVAIDHASCEGDRAGVRGADYFDDGEPVSRHDAGRAFARLDPQALHLWPPWRTG